MKGFLILLLVLVASLGYAQDHPDMKMHRLQVAEKDESGWYPAVSTEGSFRASLPIPFNDFSVRAKDPKLGQVNTYVVGGKSSDGYKFSVTEMPIAPKMKDPDLSEMLGKFQQDRANKISDVDRSMYAGFPAIAFEVSGPDGGAFMRYVKTTGSLLAIILEYPKGGRDVAIKMKARFFNSVQWKTPEATTKPR